MVIQSITICSKVGKLLVARQYSNFTKLQLEEQIKSFPKSIQENQQHTFIEINNHRYIYLPLEGLYLILITTKMSNIIDDLETIRILQRLVIEKCKSGLTEKEILENAFELLLIFDDVVSFGYRESVTQQQVNEYLLMSSNQENLDKMLKMAKENEAKEVAKKFIREKAKEQKHTPQQHFESQIQSVVQKIEVPKPTETVNATSKFSKKSGLALGQKKSIVPAIVEKKPTQKKQELLEESSQQFNPLSATINIEIQEHLNCQLSKDGGVNNFEIIGEVVLNCNDQKKLKLSVELSKMQHSLEVKLHPNLNKQQWSTKNLIQAAKESLPFNKALSTLKYKFSSQEPSQLPFIFNYWFNSNSLTLELEHQSSQLFPFISNLILFVPTIVITTVESSENSDYQITDNQVEWRISELSQKVQSCNLVLNFEQDVGVEDCFPVQVVWSQEGTLAGMRVMQVVNLEDKQQVIFQEKTGLQTKQFFIV